MGAIETKKAVEAKVGEEVYLSDVVHMFMAYEVPNSPSIARIRKYAKDNKLGVTPHELGIAATHGKAYYIRSSSFDKLAQGLGVMITGEQLMKTAFHLEYSSGQNIRQ